MARSVGNIEITVDLNTGRLQAQAKKSGHIVGEEFADAIEEELDHLSVNLKEIDGRREAEVARKQIEGILRGMEGLVDIDLTEARAALKEFREQQEAIALVLNTDIELSPDDLAEIQADFRATKEIIERNRIEVEMNLALDEAEVENTRLRAQEQLNDMKIHAEMELALSEAILDAERFRLQQEADELEMQLALHMAVAEAEITRFRQEQEANDIDLEVDVHEGPGFSGHWAKIGLAILAFGENAATALQGALAASVSIISSAVQGLGAAAGAATPLVVAFGTALGTGIIGAQGFGDALKAVNEEFATAAKEGRPMNLSLLESSDAFRNLAPNASAAASMFAKVRDELSDLRIVIQEDMFDGFDQEINDLAETVLPSLEDGLRVTAQSINGFAKDLSAIAQQTDFAAIIQALDPALDDAFDASEAFIGSLEPFLMTAAPAAERLAEMIERGAEALEDWLKSTRGQDDLASFLDDGLTSLQRWIDLLQATGRLLGSIFDAGAASGDSFVISLTNIIERWDSWMNDAENAEAIESFFDSGRDAIKAFAPVLDSLQEAFSDLVDDDAMSNLEDFAQAIADMLPALTDIMALLSDVQVAGAISLLVQSLGLLSSALNLLPDGMLEFVGIVYVANKAIGLMPAALLKAIASMISFSEASIASATASAAAATGVGGLSAALKLLVMTNAPLLILTATVTGIMLAFKIFGDSESDAAKRTDELTTALQNNVDAIVSQGDAVNNSTIGMQALTDTLWETGDGSEKLQDAFAEINRLAGSSVVGVDDVVGVIQSLQGTTDDGAAALTGLAEKMGLTGADAKALGDIVAGTDDNMKTAEQASTALGRQMTELAKRTGRPREELVRMFGALEEIQDQSENTDLTKITQELLDVASTGTEAEQAMLELAKQRAEDAGLANDAIAIYQAYTTELNKTASAADDANSANQGLASSSILIANSISDALLARQAERDALEQTRTEAIKTAQAEERLARATEDTVVQLATGMGMPEELAEGLIELGNAADDATAASEALSGSLDILFGRNIDASQTLDDFNRFLRETTEDFHKVDEETGKLADDALPKVGSALEAVFGQTEAAQNFRDTMREGVTTMFDWAAQALEAGATGPEVAAGFEAMRGQLGDLGTEFGITKEQADEFVNALIGTPGLVETVIQTPGMIDALLNAEDLTILYDAAGEPVDTAFTTIGLDPALGKTEAFKALFDALTGAEAAPTVSAENIDPAVVASDEVVGAVEATSEAVGTPTVELPSAEGVITDTETITTGLDELDGKAVISTISIPGLQTTIDMVNRLKTAIDLLPSTKSIRINVTQSGSPRNTGGDMAGRIVTSDQFTRVGERGLAEAIVPLQLPLNRVDPSVRHFAELLRGAGIHQTTTGTPGKVVNNYLTVTPASADPGAVATQIINRSAALANR